MKTLYEGILKGMDDTLTVDSAWTEIYPTPKIRDFYKSLWRSMTIVDWECPDLIRQYIDDMQSSEFTRIKRSEILGIEIRISLNSKLIDTYLYADDDLIELVGVGD